MSASDAAGRLPAHGKDQAAAQAPAKPAGAKKKYLTAFALANINVVAVLGIRNFPIMAQYGWASVTWYLLGTLFFLLPVSLIGAELATGPWPQEGGLYSWVRNGLNDRLGMTSVWCEWTENVVWFPTFLSFLAASFAYIISPNLANNGVYMLTVMLVVLWAVTIVGYFGARQNSKLTNVGSILGTILPCLLLIVFWWVFVGEGKTSEIPVSAGAFAPSFALSNLPFVASVVLIFAGMEVAGFSADKMRNPQREFPVAMFWSAGIVFLLTVLGTLAIAVVVPAKDINLAGGVMQAFRGFYTALHIPWMTIVTGILLFIGNVGGLAAWVYGPAKGLGMARRGGYLPPVFYRSNKRDSPVAVLLMQAVIGTILSFLFILLPSVSAAYWVLTVFTTEVLCIMYILMFSSALRMRRLKPVDKFPRGYAAGPAPVYYTLCVLGIISVGFALFVGLFPTSQTNLSTGAYIAVIAVGTIILAFLPVVFLPFRKPSWGAAALQEAGGGPPGEPSSAKSDQAAEGGQDRQQVGTPRQPGQHGSGSTS